MSGAGQLFVGSVLTPMQAAPDTIGNNDGGSGAQYGRIDGMRPIVDAAVAGRGYSNPGNAYDGSGATAASAIVAANIGVTTTHDWKQFAWLGSLAAGAGSVNLKVSSQVSVTGTPNNTVSVQYSTDGGATFTTIYSVTGIRATTVDVVNLTLPLNVSKVVVRASSVVGGGSGNSTHQIFEVWMEATS